MNDKIKSYIESYVKENFKFSFDKENPRVRLHECTYSSEEISEALDCLLSTNVTMGQKVREFEMECAQYFGSKHAVMVNSGSSANLLALAALANPAYSRYLKPGDEVIVPALSWSTTVWPIIQLNLVPVIVDIDLDTLNVSMDSIRNAITPRTRAIMPVHVYGNSCDIDGLQQICDEYDLLLIEDSCESMGAKYKEKSVGTFGEIGTFSLYYSHHITCLEGGLCLTDSDEILDLLRILRSHGWTRDCIDPESYNSKYPDIDPRFLFVNLGYNLRPTELQAAMACVQLGKLENFVNQRRLNANYIRNKFSEFESFIDIPIETPSSRHSWFGCPMLLKPNLSFGRNDLFSALRCANIEVRPLIAGNIAKQPALKYYEHQVSPKLDNSDYVMYHGFTFGNHHLTNENSFDYVFDVMSAFFYKN